jgi:hypothetical protein
MSKLCQRVRQRQRRTLLARNSRGKIQNRFRTKTWMQYFVPINEQKAVIDRKLSAHFAPCHSSSIRINLCRVDMFLRGFIQQEKRKGSRAKVKDIINAALDGPQYMDSLLRKLSVDGDIDEDLQVPFKR